MTDSETKERNKKLCKKYPWLIPRSWCEENLDDDSKPKNWDYEYSWYDDIPEGWEIAFGEEMIDEIDMEIKKSNLGKFRIEQIKEKYGELRFYCIGGNDEIDNIIEDYSCLSSGICIYCGKPDVRMTSGWILPVCYECWLEICRFEADDSDEMRKSYIKSTSESPLPNERRWSQYDSKQKQWVKHARDISEKANMIKAKYRQRMNEREDSKAN